MQKWKTGLSLLAMLTLNSSFKGQAADLYQDMSKPYNEYTWATTHNAQADDSHVFPIGYMNQWTNMYEQMEEEGVRGLMIDIIYDGGEVYLTHAADRAGKFVSRMEDEIVRFLNENPDAVLWFDIEVTNGELTKAQLKSAMDQLPNLTSKMFDPQHPLWANHTQWPTLSEMVAADQRVIMVIDKDKFSGDFGPYTILSRKNVTAENDYGVVDIGDCQERHGYNSPTINISGNDWSRLFTMNHFRSLPNAVLAGNDNNWDGLYPRINTCTSAAGINAQPNFLSVDFVTVGDVKEIAEVMTEGGIIFYEGNYAAQNIVCGIGVGKSRTVKGGEHGCENDEARSAELINVPANTRLQVFDSPNGSLEDDFTDIMVNVNTSEGVINSFEETVSNTVIQQSHFHNNGLDGKISRFVVTASQDYIPEPKIVFYEGNNGSQNIVCGLSITQNAETNFKYHSTCDNDETRSLKLFEIHAGVVITVYDSPSGPHGDDYTTIEVLQDIVSPYTVDTYESSYTDAYVKVTHHHHNGLDGKVSRTRIQGF